jgi:hypothetical protein
MTLPSEPDVEPANLRFLRRLVTTLTAVMICGLVIIVGLFVMRFSTSATPLPDQITLPDGSTAQSFTRGRGWYAVVTTDDQILIFDQDSGQLRQTIQINP